MHHARGGVVPPCPSARCPTDPGARLDGWSIPRRLARGTPAPGRPRRTLGGTGRRRPSPETITEPAKLLLIASMVRELLEETRHASMDEPGRKRLVEIYHRSIEELGALGQPRPPGGAPGARPAPRRCPDRVGAARRAGPARGLARGPVPRVPAGDVRAADAARPQFEQLRRRGPACAEPPTGAGTGARPATARRPVPLGSDLSLGLRPRHHPRYPLSVDHACQQLGDQHGDEREEAIATNATTLVTGLFLGVRNSRL